MVEFETFREISGYTQSNLTVDKPSCCNREVAVRKYKVTIELIDEPADVIKARIQKLWDECDNHYNWQALKAEAQKYGLELHHG